MQLLGAARLIVRWLHQPGLDALSPYLLASRTRTLLEPMLDDLRFAGVEVGDIPVGRGDEYWATFGAVIGRVGEAIVDG